MCQHHSLRKHTVAILVWVVSFPPSLRMIGTTILFLGLHGPQIDANSIPSCIGNIQLGYTLRTILLQCYSMF